jgi:hypothetical protein
LGQFKEELGDYEGKQPQDLGPFGIYVDKKIYANYVVRDGVEIPIRMRMKGVRLEKDVVLDEPLEGLDFAGVRSAYLDKKRYITIEDFRKLARGEPLRLLCSQMGRELISNVTPLVIRNAFVEKTIGIDLEEEVWRGEA